MTNARKNIKFHVFFCVEKHGYERPGFFLPEKMPINVQPYDWFGSYGNAINSDKTYLHIRNSDQKYDFSDHHETVILISKLG